MKEVEVVIHKTEDDLDHEHDMVRIVVEAVEEKSTGRGAEKGEIGAGVTKGETLVESERVVDIEVEVVAKIEAETNMREVEAEAKRGSWYLF